MEIYNRILDELGQAESVLDVGCGDGALVSLLAKKTNRKIVGLDITDRGFVEAKKLAAEIRVLHLIKCVRGDAHRVSDYFRNQRFEAITVVHTLHHLEDPVVALGEMYKVLKPSGSIVIVDWILREGKPESRCRYLIIAGIQGLLKKAGFKKTEIEEPERGLVFVRAKKEGR